MADFLQTPKVNHKVLALLEDREGNIWAGCNYEGLFRYDSVKETFVKIPFCDSLAHAQGAGRITRLHEDELGQIWIATFNGIYRYQPATGESRRIILENLPHYASEDFCTGKGETMWLGTHNGLFQVDLKGRVLAIYDTKRGFPSNQIHRVRQDLNGNLWIGTNRGLYRLRLPDGQLLHFDRRDGLVANVVSGGFERMPNGEIFIGAGKGFNYFFPEKVPLNACAPKVVLNSVQVMNQKRRFPEGQALVLRPGEDVVSFEFAALNYSQPEKNRYAYRLEGFDEEWTFTTQPIVIYTNLDGGDYTLEVRAANNDGIWSENTLCIPMRIIPPFHQTWYFPALLALTVLLAGLLLAAYRRSQRQALELIRNRIARDLHDDMGSTLSSIRFFSEYARSKVAGQEEVDSVLQRISSSAALLSESMQDIIWTINTRHDQLEDLVTRMRSFGIRMMEARQIDFVVRVSDGFRPARLNISQRRNIYLVFKEAINNAIKYSDCSRVTLFLTIRSGHLKMIIEDNGKGFDPNHAEQGNGMENMEQRATEIGGTLQLRSRPGKGTCVELTARLGKKGKWI